jgi:UDP:flavonoid glycosyltransferase YjiC (YdhE family)
MDTPFQTKKVLFVTNSESGQANTVLAMALEATKRPHVQVHIASFPVLERRVERLSPNIHFHPLDGKPMLEMMAEQGVSEETLPHPPTTKSHEPYGRSLAVVLTGWDVECAFCSLSF